MFWTILDRIGAWGWQPYYGYPLNDGLPWDLTITYRGQFLRSGGDLRVDRPPLWDLFERSVDALVGRAHNRAPHPYNAVVENLQEVLRLMVLVEAVRRDTDRALPLLIEFLKEGSAGGQTVDDLLAEVGPAAQQAVPELTQALKHEDERGYWAVRALGHIGPGAAAAVPALREVLKREAELCDKGYFQLLEETAQTLVRIGPQARGALAALIEAVSGGGPVVRRGAARALGEAGPGVSEAMPALLEALKDEDEWVREAAAEALKRIQRKDGG
jgi:HEAT repeat protein